MGNIYFELTEAFNARAPTVVLASGQAVVYYRVAIMSKDGDWIICETHDACERVIDVLESRGGTYRPSAPLDIRWLAGGWSSHFEFADDRHRRIRCDFFSRPPRVESSALGVLFTSGDTRALRAIDIESLILMKRTQRAKDYAVIGELATRLPPAREVELTTDPDRLLTLAPVYGRASARLAVQAALAGDRRAVVLGIAAETDDFQTADRGRVHVYEHAARAYLDAFRREGLSRQPLRTAHTRACALAEQFLPVVPSNERSHADAE